MTHDFDDILSQYIKKRDREKQDADPSRHAKEARKLYEAYLYAGFSKKQALEMVKAIVAARAGRDNP